MWEEGGVSYLLRLTLWPGILSLPDMPQSKYCAQQWTYISVFPIVLVYQMMSLIFTSICKLSPSDQSHSITII